MYSIGEVSKITGLSISTLRYYDKNGILPNIKRNSSFNREFDDKDLEALKVIQCLKVSGMQLKDIKLFMKWISQGNKTLDKRLDMFVKQEEAIKNQINELNNALFMIQFKKWYYSEAVKDGSDKKVKNMKLDDMPLEIQELYNKTHV